MYAFVYRTVVALAVAASTPAIAADIYAPGSQYATQTGNTNNVVFDTQDDQHIQWFFNPSLFGTTPVDINSVSLRFSTGFTNQGYNSGAFLLDNDFHVSLGTVASASTTFADNLTNAVTVMSGARSIPFTVGADSGQVKPFGITLTFDKSFTYNPADGLLVFDMYVPAQSYFGTLDFVRGDSNAFRLFSNDPDAVTGSIQSFAPVARFDVTPGVASVPEPASWAMTIIGFGIVGGAARQRKRAGAAATPYAGRA